MLIVEKSLSLEKQTRVCAENTRGRHKCDTKNTRKKRNVASNLCWQSVQDPCRIVFEYCRWMFMEQKFMTFGLENPFMFGKFSDFYNTSRLCNQNGEVCLQKYQPISGNLSFTICSKQNANHYQNHLTIESNLKVEKRIIISKTSTTLPLKNTLGVCA